MSAAGYDINTSASVALAAATAKTVLGAKAHANSGLQLKGFLIAFDGITPAAIPVLVEVCQCTFGANAPGTNSTSMTPLQAYGRVLTPGFTAGYNWTTEPTTIGVLRSFFLPAYNGAMGYQYPLGQEPDTALGEGLVLRLTAPAIVNIRASMAFERI